MCIFCVYLRNLVAFLLFVEFSTNCWPLLHFSEMAADSSTGIVDSTQRSSFYQAFCEHHFQVVHFILLLLLLLHPFSGLFPRTTWVSRYQKGKPFWILLEQEMMGWQWHQLDHMQIICTLLQTDNNASTSPLSFLQAGCPSCRPTNSVKALI